jgi:Tol biopolymer transport system component
LLVADERVQEIWIADLAGIVKVNLTHLPGPTPEEEVRLLREWQEKGAGEKVVWKLRAQVADSNPSWSPNGSFLIVERNSASYSTMLWVKAGGLR